MSETKETVDRKSTDEFGLKPCPFCGKKQSEWSPDCACGNPALDSMTKGAWNRRPIEDALRARAKKAEAMVERLLVAGRDLLRVTDEDFPKVSERWIALVEEWEGKDD